MAWIEAKDIQDEEKIVWLEDISRLDYVRQVLVDCPNQQRRPGKRFFPGRPVGYSVLKPDACGRWHMFRRRLFWLKDYDRDSGDPCYRVGAPTEAVDPQTVAPGVPGRITDRAWGPGYRGEQDL
jgi:hypothetical protein